MMVISKMAIIMDWEVLYLMIITLIIKMKMNQEFKIQAQLMLNSIRRPMKGERRLERKSSIK
jgi:hypothetical protein